MSILKQAFEDARVSGSVAPVFEPLVNSTVFVIGVIDESGKATMALKESSRPGKWCATISEKKEWLQGVDESRIIPISGRTLVEMVGDNDLLVVYDTGGDLLHSAHLEAFRKVLT